MWKYSEWKELEKEYYKWLDNDKYIEDCLFSVISFLSSKGLLKEQWIPINERLPEEYEVLCCNSRGGMLVAHPFLDPRFGYVAESKHEFMCNCVAWQPLPEEYKNLEEEFEEL